MQKKRKVDSDEDESMEESEESDEDYDGKEGDLWAKVRVKSTSKKISNIVPNQVHHFVEKEQLDCWEWRNELRYGLNESQYLVANSD